MPVVWHSAIFYQTTDATATDATDATATATAEAPTPTFQLGQRFFRALRLSYLLLPTHLSNQSGLWYNKCEVIFVDKIAALRRYEGKRMRVDAEVYGEVITFEGVLTILVVGEEERICIKCDDGLEIHIVPVQ